MDADNRGSPTLDRVLRNNLWGSDTWADIWWSMGTFYVIIWRKNSESWGNSKCKGPEMEVTLRCSVNSREICIVIAYRISKKQHDREFGWRHSHENRSICGPVSQDKNLSFYSKCKRNKLKSWKCRAWYNLIYILVRYHWKCGRHNCGAWRREVMRTIREYESDTNKTVAWTEKIVVKLVRKESDSRYLSEGW